MEAEVAGGKQLLFWPALCLRVQALCQQKPGEQSEEKVVEGREALCVCVHMCV